MITWKTTHPDLEGQQSILATVEAIVNENLANSRDGIRRQATRHFNREPWIAASGGVSVAEVADVVINAICRSVRYERGAHDCAQSRYGKHVCNRRQW